MIKNGVKVDEVKLEQAGYKIEDKTSELTIIRKLGETPVATITAFTKHGKKWMWVLTSNDSDLYDGTTEITINDSGKVQITYEKEGELNTLLA